MIKSFKIFENLLKYSEGDYVLINLKKVQDQCEMMFLDTDDYFVPDYDKVKIVFKNSTDENFPYICKFPNGKYFGFHDDDIIRKLTDEEIQEYGVKKGENKFNI